MQHQTTITHRPQQLVQQVRRSMQRFAEQQQQQQHQKHQQQQQLQQQQHSRIIIQRSHPPTWTIGSPRQSEPPEPATQSAAT